MIIRIIAVDWSVINKLLSLFDNLIPLLEISIGFQEEFPRKFIPSVTKLNELDTYIQDIEKTKIQHHTSPEMVWVPTIGKSNCVSYCKLVMFQSPFNR